MTCLVIDLFQMVAHGGVAFPVRLTRNMPAGTEFSSQSFIEHFLHDNLFEAARFSRFREPIEKQPVTHTFKTISTGRETLEQCNRQFHQERSTSLDRYSRRTLVYWCRMS